MSGVQRFSIGASQADCRYMREVRHTTARRPVRSVDEQAFSYIRRRLPCRGLRHFQSGNVDLESFGIALLLLSVPVFFYFFFFLMYGTQLVPAREIAIAKALARREAQISSDQIGYCPACAQEIPLAASSCPKCDADFTAPDGWKPLTTAQILGPLSEHPGKNSKDKGKKVSPVRRA